MSGAIFMLAIASWALGYAVGYGNGIWVMTDTLKTCPCKDFGSLCERCRRAAWIKNLPVITRLGKQFEKKRKDPQP